MDTLDNTEWDVIISGTGLKQSLLALSLSRSGKRILHIDANAYYGGAEAALSLSEAEAWAKTHSEATGRVFSHAEIVNSQDVGTSRSYSLALAPQLIFARSNILSALVTSASHDQLEFQAVGSWFVLDTQAEDAGGEIPGLRPVPGSREEVFQDKRLDIRTKRALMKFIRQASTDGVIESGEDLCAYLEAQGIPESAHAAILALTLSPNPPQETSVASAVPNITRYLQSIGHLGAGFAALTPKYGGIAEIAQVACRACAVGGGVYVLNRGIDDDLQHFRDTDKADGLTLKLGDEQVKTEWLVCGAEALRQPTATSTWSRGIYIVKSPLTSLFPLTSEGGVTPAGAVIMVPGPDQLPVYLYVHSSDSGDCPNGKCVAYASVKLPAEQGYERLQQAVRKLAEPSWSLQFQQHASERSDDTGNVLSFSNTGFELALEDSILDEVKLVWQRITGAEQETFMQFMPRSNETDNE